MPEPTQNVKHFCLVCGQLMRAEHELLWSDYVCAQDEHHFSYRVIDDHITIMRLRLGEGDNRLHLRVFYREKYSEVWRKSGTLNRLRINHIIIPDFTNLDKTANKLKTYLVFG